MNHEIQYRAVLAAMQGVTRLLRILVNEYSLKQICEAISREELKRMNVNPNIIELFFSEKEKIHPEKEYEKVRKAKVDILMPQDHEYPFLLKQLSSPPLFLYKRGEGRADLYKGLQLAIVGSRNMNQYSQKVLEHLIPDLVLSETTIISGLAYGVDVKAHREVIKNNGKAVAVLGNSIDTIYPVGHRYIAEEIIKSGGVIFSEYGPGCSPPKYSFPARNRIIAGLAHGTLVVQAGQKSGSLITAKQALDENREVMAIPGDIFSEQYKGSLQILSEGAHLITSAKDILELFGQAKQESRSQPTPKFTEKEQALFNLLQKESHSISRLSEMLQKPIPEIQIMLTSLEMQGVLTIQGEMVSVQDV